MTYAKWGFRALLLVIVAGFLWYTLPRHEIVRVVGTYQQRVDLNGWTRIFWSGSSKTQQVAQGTRDVQFVQTIRANGSDMVLRNEDTGWGWPPYFKFDTASLQARAEDQKSSSDAPKWAVVTYYGMRSQLLSTFPNAISIKPVSGPDVRIIPWFNIFFLGFVVVLVLFLRVTGRLFFRRVIAPIFHRG